MIVTDESPNARFSYPDPIYVIPVHLPTSRYRFDIDDGIGYYAPIDDLWSTRGTQACLSGILEVDRNKMFKRLPGYEWDPYASLLEEAISAGTAWPPLRAGFFGGSVERFKDVAERYNTELLSRLGWH